MSAGERGQIAAILKKNNSHNIPLSEILAKLVGWKFLMLQISARIIFHFLCTLFNFKISLNLLYCRGAIFKGGFLEQDNYQYEYEARVKFYLSIRRVKHASQIRIQTLLCHLGNTVMSGWQASQISCWCPKPKEDICSRGSLKCKPWWISSLTTHLCSVSGIEQPSNMWKSSFFAPVLNLNLDKLFVILQIVCSIFAFSFATECFCFSFHDGRVMVNYPWDDRWIIFEEKARVELDPTLTLGKTLEMFTRKFKTQFSWKTSFSQSRRRRRSISYCIIYYISYHI